MKNTWRGHSVGGGGTREGQGRGNTMWVQGPLARDRVCSEDRTWAYPEEGEAMRAAGLGRSFKGSSGFQALLPAEEREVEVRSDQRGTTGWDDREQDLAQSKRFTGKFTTAVRWDRLLPTVVPGPYYALCQHTSSFEPIIAARLNTLHTSPRGGIRNHRATWGTTVKPRNPTSGVNCRPVVSATNHSSTPPPGLRSGSFPFCSTCPTC